MLLITGANGQLAGATIEALRKRVASHEIAVTTRDPNSPYARELAASGISVRTADFDVPETLPDAFKGVTKALIIPSPVADDLRLQQNYNAIAAAKAAGVKHLLYCSFMNATANAAMAHIRVAHYPTEVALRTSGLTYTILRNAIFAEALLWSLDAAAGVLRRPAPDAELTYVARGDCGLANAVVLTTEGHDNKTYTFTMARSYTADEVAQLMTKVSGRSIRLELVPEDVWPKELADVIASIKAGELTCISEDFKTVTGSEPKTMAAFFEEHWPA